jgi:hypothetical protein
MDLLTVAIVFFIVFMALLMWNLYENKRATRMNMAIIVVASISYIGMMIPYYKNQGYPGGLINTEDFVIISYQVKDKDVFMWIYEMGSRVPRNVVFPMSPQLKKNINDMEKAREQDPNAIFKGTRGKRKSTTNGTGVARFVDMVLDFVYHYTNFGFDIGDAPVFSPLEIDRRFIK